MEPLERLGSEWNLNQCLTTVAMERMLARSLQKAKIRDNNLPGKRMKKKQGWWTIGFYVVDSEVWSLD